MLDFNKIKLVVFDIDGTLYPNFVMYLWMFPSFLLNPKLSIAFFKVRKEIRKLDLEGCEYKDFYEKQAELIAPKIKSINSWAKKDIEKYLYKVWKNSAAIIKPLPNLKKFLNILKEKKIKIYALSDLPVENKLKYLGVEQYFEKSFCAESVGKLKPHKAPFEKLIKESGLKPDEILYIGNSFSKDIEGAKGAKLLTAYITNKPSSKSDFDFKNYKEFEKFFK